MDQASPRYPILSTMPNMLAKLLRELNDEGVLAVTTPEQRHEMLAQVESNLAGEMSSLQREGFDWLVGFVPDHQFAEFLTKGLEFGKRTMAESLGTATHTQIVRKVPEAKVDLASMVVSCAHEDVDTSSLHDFDDYPAEWCCDCGAYRTKSHGWVSPNSAKPPRYEPAGTTFRDILISMIAGEQVDDTYESSIKAKGPHMRITIDRHDGKETVVYIPNASTAELEAATWTRVEVPR